MQHPPFGCCASGRTPASGRRAPQGGGLKRCPNPRLGSLFAAQNHIRCEREPQQPRKRLISSPHLGGCGVSRGGPTEHVVREGGRCTTQTPSPEREPGAPRTKLGSAPPAKLGGNGRARARAAGGALPREATTPARKTGARHRTIQFKSWIVCPMSRPCFAWQPTWHMRKTQ